ncbi:hypothetical protein PENTCL1PPCAC_20950, partial [Pristionchus entomophagus]
IRTWTGRLEGPPGSLYEGEHFLLQFRFAEPSHPTMKDVTFVGDHIPIHPGIFSNGHYFDPMFHDDWTPVRDARDVCRSVLSMLSSCEQKHPPSDDLLYVGMCARDPLTAWTWDHGE